MAAYRIKIKTDLRGVDVRALEGYLRALVMEATGEPVTRVTTHGVFKPHFSDRLRDGSQY